jgi:hypothetical protein
MVADWITGLTSRLLPWLAAEAAHGGELLVRVLAENATAKLGLRRLEELTADQLGQVEARVAGAIKCLGGDAIDPAILGQIRADIAIANDGEAMDAPRWAAAMRCVSTLDSELDKHYGAAAA